MMYILRRELSLCGSNYLNVLEVRMRVEFDVANLYDVVHPPDVGLTQPKKWATKSILSEVIYFSWRIP